MKVAFHANNSLCLTYKTESEALFYIVNQQTNHFKPHIGWSPFMRKQQSRDIFRYLGQTYNDIETDFLFTKLNVFLLCIMEKLELISLMIYHSLSQIMIIYLLNVYDRLANRQTVESQWPEDELFSSKCRYPGIWLNVCIHIMYMYISKIAMIIVYIFCT